MGTRLPAELVVGVGEIDGQHRDLLEAVAAARAAAASGDHLATRAAVTALGDVLLAHFAAEEASMVQSLYPDLARHRSAHELFMQDFAQLVRELEGGLSETAAQWIGTRVPEWVRFHIRVNDAPLGTYLAARRHRPAAPGARSVKTPAS